MGSDPRTEAAAKALGWPVDELVCEQSVTAVLAAADAADRDRGVVRVDTRDEATIGRLADILDDQFADLHRFPHEWALEARAVLAALTQEDNHG